MLWKFSERQVIMQTTLCKNKIKKALAMNSSWMGINFVECSWLWGERGILRLQCGSNYNKISRIQRKLHWNEMFQKFREYKVSYIEMKCFNNSGKTRERNDQF